jgi:hypothetical protein
MSASSLAGHVDLHWANPTPTTTHDDTLPDRAQRPCGPIVVPAGSLGSKQRAADLTHGDVVASIADVFPAKPAVVGAQPLAVGSGSDVDAVDRTAMDRPLDGQIISRTETPKGVSRSWPAPARCSSHAETPASSGSMRQPARRRCCRPPGSVSGLGYGHGSTVDQTLRRPAA